MHYTHFIRWLAPNVCLLCGNHSIRAQDLCQPCFQELPSLPYLPNYDRIYSLFSYEPPVTELILRLKFKHDLVVARLLGELLAHKIQHEWYRDHHLPTAIIPVPLHPKRLKERGFNQSLEIARPIAKQLHIPLHPHACQRIKFTAPQATLQANARLQNVQNAFRFVEQFNQQHVAVLDDVITTGHTIHEFCRALNKAGATTIDIWCCAKREMNFSGLP